MRIAKVLLNLHECICELERGGEHDRKRSGVPNLKPGESPEDYTKRLLSCCADVLAENAWLRTDEATSLAAQASDLANDLGALQDELDAAWLERGELRKKLADMELARTEVKPDIELTADAQGRAELRINAFCSTNYREGRDLDLLTNTGVRVVISRYILPDIMDLLTEEKNK